MFEQKDIDLIRKLNNEYDEHPDMLIEDILTGHTSFVEQVEKFYGLKTFMRNHGGFRVAMSPTREYEELEERVTDKEFPEDLFRIVSIFVGDSGLVKHRLSYNAVRDYFETESRHLSEFIEFYVAAEEFDEFIKDKYRQCFIAKLLASKYVSV